MKMRSILLAGAVLALALSSLTACAGTVTTTNQWAASATASSEFTSSDYSAQQATGAPDTTTCGDTKTAWASFNKSTVESLNLSFATPVHATQAVIYVSLNPGYVTLVELLDTDGNYHSIYTSTPQAVSPCPQQLSIPISKTTYLVQGMRVTIDQTTLGSWSEIDAVQLTGSDK